MGTWYYSLVEDTNGAKLIEEFQQINANLKFSLGSQDKETDFIIYSEIQDNRADFGRVLLFKFSLQMLKDIKSNLNLPNNEDYISLLCKEIYERENNNNTFKHTLYELTKAFSLSYILQVSGSKGIPDAVMYNEFLNKSLDDFYKTLRNILKLEEKFWKPNLHDKDYGAQKIVNDINFLIEKGKSSLDVLNSLSLFLKTSRLSITNPIIILVINKLIDCVDFFIKIINALVTTLQILKNKIMQDFAYFCGVWDGLMEFVCGILEIGFFLIKYESYDKKDFTLQLEISELFEEAVNTFIAKFKENPNFIEDEIHKSIESYIKERYEDQKLDQYQIAHNLGEDSVLLIDTIISVVSAVKGLSKVAQKVPKFVEWIDDVFFRMKEKPPIIQTKININLIDDVEKGITKLDVDEFGNKRKPNDYTRHANYSEMKVDAWFETQTFTINNRTGTLKRVSTKTITSLDEPITKGIDGVYEFSSPPPKYIITEVKYNTAKLNTKPTKSGGTQMSKKWVRKDLENGAVSPELADDILLNGYEALHCHVAKDGKVTINLIEQTQTTAKKGKLWNAKVQ